MVNKVRSLFLILFAALQLSMVSFAAEEEAVQVQDGILQLVAVYTDTKGNEHPVQGGSGFLIGSAEAGAEYVITAKEVTSVPKETTERVKALYEEPQKELKLTYNIKAVVNRDIMVELQLVAESDEMGFAVWKLAQPLHDRQALSICDEPLTATSGQKAWVMGFPTAPSLTGETAYYVKNEVISEEGILIGDGREENIKYLYHNIVPTPGMLGGPILNADGNVIALNQSKEAQEGYYALQIAEILPVLDALGIPYTVAKVKEVPPLWLILLIAGSSLIVITAFGLIIWHKTKPKREQRKQKKKEEFTVTQAPPVFTAQTVRREDYRTLVSKDSQRLDERSCGQNTGDTIVLLPEENERKPYAYLIRKRTGEKIKITQKNFVIGKDPSQTDYCVNGNSAISRAHAAILHKGNGYDVSDKNATNGTFVNGVRIAAFQKTSLQEGDILRLADEDFEFRHTLERGR